jgi:hypothetical protein
MKERKKERVMSNLKLFYTAVVLGLSVFSCASNAGAQQASTAVKQEKEASLDSRQANSRKAVELLQHTDEARRRLLNGDPELAVPHVATGLMLLAEMNGGDHITIYPELERMTFLTPVEAAKKDITVRVEDAAAPNNRPPQVKLNTGQYTVILLKINDARKSLTEAKAALTKNQTEGADQALLSVLKGVILETLTTDLPLVNARQMVFMAWTQQREDRAQLAIQSLSTASNALGNYLTAADAPRKNEVTKLKQEIDDAVKRSQSEKTDLSEKIGIWWNRMADWTDEASLLSQVSRRR